MQGYSKEQLEEALCILWDFVDDNDPGSPPNLCNRAKKLHPILEELWEYGISGPAGLGLGRVGGHAP